MPHLMTSVPKFEPIVALRYRLGLQKLLFNLSVVYLTSTVHVESVPLGR
jgi:hypothetical protein